MLTGLDVAELSKMDGVSPRTVDLQGGPAVAHVTRGALTGPVTDGDLEPVHTARHPADPVSRVVELSVLVVANDDVEVVDGAVVVPCGVVVALAFEWALVVPGEAPTQHAGRTVVVTRISTGPRAAPPRRRTARPRATT